MMVVVMITIMMICCPSTSKFGTPVQFLVTYYLC